MASSSTSNAVFYPFLQTHNAILYDLYGNTTREAMSHSHAAILTNHASLRQLLTGFPIPHPSSSLQFLIRTYLLYRDPVCTRVIEQPTRSIYSPFDVVIINLILHLGTVPKSKDGSGPSRRPVISSFDADITFAMCGRFPASSMRKMLEERSGSELGELRKKLQKLVQEVKDRKLLGGRGETLKHIKYVGELLDGMRRATGLLGRWGGGTEVRGLLSVLEKVDSVKKGSKGSAQILCWVKCVENAVRQVLVVWVRPRTGNEIIRPNREKDVAEAIDEISKCKKSVAETLLGTEDIRKSLAEWRDEWSSDYLKKLDDTLRERSIPEPGFHDSELTYRASRPGDSLDDNTFLEMYEDEPDDEEFDGPYKFEDTEREAQEETSGKVESLNAPLPLAVTDVRRSNTRERGREQGRGGEGGTGGGRGRGRSDGRIEGKGSGSGRGRGLGRGRGAGRGRPRGRRPNHSRKERSIRKQTSSGFS